MSKHVRNYEAVALRAAGGDDGVKRLAGTIVPFDVETDIGGGVVEVIRPGAISQDAMQDVVLLYQHDSAQPIARTGGGGLNVWTDDAGMHFEAELPDTQLARDAWTLAQRGVLGGMSIGMYFARDGVKRSTQGGVVRQVVTKIARVFEGSLVTWPAYAGKAPVHARSQEAANAAVDRAREILKAKREAKGMAPKPAAGSITTRAVDPYAPGSTHSWWRDLALAVDIAQEFNGAPTVLPGDPPRAERGTFILDAVSAAERPGALDRLAAARELLAGFNMTATSGGEFMISGSSNHVAASFAQAARSNTVVAPYFQQFPLPDAPGPSLNFVKFTTSAITAAADTAEAATITSASPVTATASTNIAMIVAECDVSWQAWDLSSGPSVDEALSQDMAAAIATAVDNQLLNGTNANGQTLGLFAVSSPNAYTYTQASPTTATFMTAIAQAWSTGVTARARRLDVAFMHTRRLAWLAGQNAYVIEPPDTQDQNANTDVVLAPGISAVASPLVPTNISSTQDEIVMARRSDLQYYVSPVTVKVADNTLVSTGQLKYLAYCYLAAVPHRYPGAITIITGTGLAAPAGY